VTAADRGPGASAPGATATTATETAAPGATETGATAPATAAPGQTAPTAPGTPGATHASGRPPRPATSRREPWLAPLLLRLHFYAGVLVGPFVLVAALTGAAYAVSPTLERALYADELTAPVTASTVPLAEQVAAARAVVGEDAALVAVRPAPEPGDTTRVMFAADGLLDGQTRAVFVDPADASVRGDLPVYGTSGSLPLRTTISDLHRSLGLGDVGRVYSELAASWLGVVVVGGVVLWVLRFRRTRGRARLRRDLTRPDLRATGYRRPFTWHASTGILLAVGALFLSATGITWSQFAGENVTALRSALSWQAPALDTALDTALSDGSGADADGTGTAAGGSQPTAADPHAHHGGSSGAGGATGPGGAGTSATDVALDDTRFDSVLAAAQQVNVDTGRVEIRPPAASGTAWTVTEIGRSWPTQVDAVAVDGDTLATVDRTDFADHPFMAKLARWGIDAHMGTLFGLPNQLLLVVTALGLATMVVLGYAMWWTRRPTRPAGAPRSWRPGRPAAAGALARAPWWGLGLVGLVAVGLGTFLPVLGVSLLAFVLVDALVTVARVPGAPPAG